MLDFIAASIEASKSMVLKAKPRVSTASRRLRTEMSLILVMGWFTFLKVTLTTTASSRNMRRNGGGGGAVVGLRRQSWRMIKTLGKGRREEKKMGG